VITFNRLLRKRVLETPSLVWLDFFEGLLTPAGNLVPEFELDGTHMSPKYLKLLEKSLESVYIPE
jgi:hypothetical protein